MSNIFGSDYLDYVGFTLEAVRGSPYLTVEVKRGVLWAERGKASSATSLRAEASLRRSAPSSACGINLSQTGR
ncbi:MAG: hypothetical protein QW587_12005 [Candidatus Bathyarchaeia archaeon]